MAPERQQPDVVRYVTVRDAAERLGTTERTIRRWIKQKRLRFIQDESKFVRINLTDIEQLLSKRQKFMPSLQEQVASLLERVATLEDQQQEHGQLITSLSQQVQGWQSLLLPTEDQEAQKEGGTTIARLQSALADVLMKQPHRVRPQELTLLEKRGLPPETEHLVDFVKVHQPQEPMTIYRIKQLFAAGEIELTIYHREGDAQRNKKEWWITQEQHVHIVSYFQQHAISYSPCTQCEHLTAQKTPVAKVL